jgi:hypothetical protein
MTCSNTDGDFLLLGSGQTLVTSFAVMVGLKIAMGLIVGVAGFRE